MSFLPIRTWCWGKLSRSQKPEELESNEVLNKKCDQLLGKLSDLERTVLICVLVRQDGD